MTIDFLTTEQRFQTKETKTVLYKSGGSNNFGGSSGSLTHNGGTTTAVEQQIEARDFEELRMTLRYKVLE